MGIDQERRQHPRSPHELAFLCYIDGARFEGVSVDVSSGGLFLSTTESVRPGSMVMLAPKGDAIRHYPVVLFGRVTHSRPGKGSESSGSESCAGGASTGSTSS